MTLDRWLALVILSASLIYGYAAFFTMDDKLPPIMMRNPVWPSTFPKILSVAAILLSLCILLGVEKPLKDREKKGLEHYRLRDYQLFRAFSLVSIMILYALTLRPLGFFLATIGFLTVSAVIMGERKFHFLLPVTTVATLVIWYLVAHILGIFMRPLPNFL